jgi:hypothetical protein
MKESDRVVIPLKKGTQVSSLCWHGDELVDWVGGVARYRLDGTVVERHINWAYRFDRAGAATDGQYVVISEALGTKGLLLKGDRLLREINRSYYCANAYEYPVALSTLADGRAVIAHCPEEYCKIELEEVERAREALRPLLFRRVQRRLGARAGVYANLTETVEVSAQRLERVLLAVDLLARPHPEPAEHRHRRAPALHGVLEEEGGHYARQYEPASPARRAQRDAEEGERRRVRLKHTLHVPLALQLPDAAVDLLPPGGRIPGDPLFGLTVDAGVDLVRRVSSYAVGLLDAPGITSLKVLHPNTS